MAASVTGGGTLTLNGAASSLKNNLNGSYVAAVSGTGSKMDLTNTTVSSNAATNHGLYAANNATLIMNGGSVTSNGADKKTLTIMNGATATLTGTVLQAAGDRSNVVFADNNAQVTLTNAQLQFTGNTPQRRWPRWWRKTAARSP